MSIQGFVKHAMWFTVLAGLLLAPVPAGAQDRSAAALHDGVVVDPAGGAAYVTSPSGEVVAIDLASGRRLWASGTAARPLAVAGDTLVAQAAPGPGEQLAIVSVDKRNGGEKRRSNVALPGTLRAGVIGSPSQKTVVEGTVDPNGDVVVSWAIEERVARGANADDGTEPVHGAARVDTDSGQVAVVAVTAPIDSGALSNLTPGQMTELRSSDGQYVLRSQRSSDPSAVRTPYRWTVARITGEVVGAFDAPTSATPFVVHGSQLVHVAQAGGYLAGGRFISEPLRMRAVDLASGAELWTVPVLDAASVLPPP